jgi:hypothetical protein
MSIWVYEGQGSNAIRILKFHSLRRCEGAKYPSKNCPLKSNIHTRQTYR